MMYFKNKTGFTLIEVLFALMIMGLVFGSVFVSQGSAIRAIKSFSLRLQRVMAAKEFLIEMTTGIESGNEETQQERLLKDEGPVTRLSFSQEESKSTVIKNFNDIVVQRVKAEWQDEQNKRTEELVTFAFKPKQEKKAS